MGRVKNWKPGDIGWIQTCDLNGIIYQKLQQVKVLSVESEGMHPIKVQVVKSGDVLYCALAELQTSAAKAIGISVGYMARHLTGDPKTIRGYKFERMDR